MKVLERIPLESKETIYYIVEINNKEYCLKSTNGGESYFLYDYTDLTEDQKQETIEMIESYESGTTQPHIDHPGEEDVLEDV